jgi:hypothetical protein
MSARRGSLPRPVRGAARATTTQAPTLRGDCKWPGRSSVNRRGLTSQMAQPLPHCLELKVSRLLLLRANLGTTSVYLRGIDTEEIIATVHARAGARRCRPPPDCGSERPDTQAAGAPQTLPLHARVGDRFADQCGRHDGSRGPSPRARTSSGVPLTSPASPSRSWPRQGSARAADPDRQCADFFVSSRVRVNRRCTGLRS